MNEEVTALFEDDYGNERKVTRNAIAMKSIMNNLEVKGHANILHLKTDKETGEISGEGYTIVRFVKWLSKTQENK